jgi:hypothetical protein
LSTSVYRSAINIGVSDIFDIGVYRSMYDRIRDTNGTPTNGKADTRDGIRKSY